MSDSAYRAVGTVQYSTVQYSLSTVMMFGTKGGNMCHGIVTVFDFWVCINCVHMDGLPAGAVNRQFMYLFVSVSK